MKSSKDVWQDAFDEAIDAGESEFFASKAGDEAVADFLAEAADDAYERHRDDQMIGVRGGGKTVLTQSIGKAHDVPTIAMDTGQMKGGIVGTTEAAIRDAFRTIKSIGGKRVLVLGMLKAFGEDR